MMAFWRAIYGLVKENIPGLIQNPEVSSPCSSVRSTAAEEYHTVLLQLKPFGRTSANLHCKVDQVFALLTGKKK